MQYSTFHADGWLIGSGPVESANKVVVEACLKGPGCTGRASVNPMLSLRNAMCNDCWEEEWTETAAWIRRVGVCYRLVQPNQMPIVAPPTEKPGTQRVPAARPEGVRDCDGLFRSGMLTRSWRIVPRDTKRRGHDATHAVLCRMRRAYAATATISTGTAAPIIAADAVSAGAAAPIVVAARASLVSTAAAAACNSATPCSMSWVQRPRRSR